MKNQNNVTVEEKNTTLSLNVEYNGVPYRLEWNQEREYITRYIGRQCNEHYELLEYLKEEMKKKYI